MTDPGHRPGVALLVHPTNHSSEHGPSVDPRR